MNEQFSTNESIRDSETLNAIICDSIEEVVSLFEGEMSPRDHQLLESVVSEKLTPPEGRLVYIRQLTSSIGASAELSTYINQVLQTLRQKFNEAEQERCQAFSGSLINDI